MGQVVFFHYSMESTSIFAHSPVKIVYHKIVSSLSTWSWKFHKHCCHQSCRWVKKLTSAQLEFAKDRIIRALRRKRCSYKNGQMSSFSVLIWFSYLRTDYMYYPSFQLTASHENGAHPIHKAVIMPCGSALWMTSFSPFSWRDFRKRQAIGTSSCLHGWRVAKEIVFGQDHITTGVSRTSLIYLNWSP